VELFCWDANDPTQTEPKKLKLVIFAGEGTVPEDAIEINAIEYVYTNAAKVVNPNYSDPDDYAEIIGFPRMDKVFDSGIGYEIEVDGDTLRIKIEMGTMFEQGRPDGQVEAITLTFLADGYQIAQE